MARFGSIPTPVVLGAAALALLTGCTEQIMLPQFVLSDAQSDGLPSAREDGPRSVGGSEADAASSSVDECLPGLVQHAQRRPAMVVALNRSRSMRTGKLGSANRFEAAKRAVAALLGRYQFGIDFGYEDFPIGCSGSTCCAAPVLVRPQPGSASAIEQAMRCDSRGAECSGAVDEAPVAEALAACRMSLSRSDQEKLPRYVLLITDGDPSCSFDVPARASCDRAIAEVTGLKSTLRVQTMVIALGAVGGSRPCLDALAREGNLDPSNWPLRLQAANDEDELREALDLLLSTVSGAACRFGLPVPRRRRADIIVRANDTVVRRDPQRLNGWEFAESSDGEIEIFGSWCDRLKTEPVDVDLIVCEH